MENRLMRSVWERLPAEERRELLEQMGKQHGMILLGEETFSRWGQTTQDRKSTRLNSSHRP